MEIVLGVVGFAILFALFVVLPGRLHHRHRAAGTPEPETSAGAEASVAGD